MSRSVTVEVNCFIEGYGNLSRTVSFKAPELKQKSINGTRKEIRLTTAPLNIFSNRYTKAQAKKKVL